MSGGYSDVYSMEGPIPGFRKSYALVKRVGLCTWEPVVYFARPRNVAPKDYEAIMKGMKIMLPKKGGASV